MDNFANGYTTTLNGSISNSVTSLTLTSATGAPTAPFRILIGTEIILVGARSGTACSSCTRGAEGTTAATHTNGDAITHLLTVGGLQGCSFVGGAEVFPFTTPVDSQFAWVNQGTASIVAAPTNALCLSVLAASGDSIKLRKMSAPSTPYTITAALLPGRPNINFAAIGLAWRQSSDGKIVTFAYVHDTTGFTANSMGVQKFTNATTFSANYGSNMNFTPCGLLWMQISDNGTNRICRVSGDGANWLQVHSVGRTDFLTGDEVGFFANASQATWPVNATLVSWAVS